MSDVVVAVAVVVVVLMLTNDESINLSWMVYGMNTVSTTIYEQALHISLRRFTHFAAAPVDGDDDVIGNVPNQRRSKKMVVIRSPEQQNFPSTSRNFLREGKARNEE